jgi:long-chain acyl-CoA synthetase
MSQANQLTTVPSFIRNTVANIHPKNHTFLIHKVKDTWVEISYGEALLEKIDAISAWLLNLGIKKATGFRSLSRTGQTMFITTRRCNK